ncbi:unnamed protein product [Urochloa humidicola]
MSGRETKKASTADGGDRISGLPDEILHRVLWHLPAPEAVRTSVLARRWRPLWKSTRRLAVTHPWRSGTTACGQSSPSIYKLNRFVNRLLLLRDHLPLDECKLSFPGFPRVDDDEVDVWIRHALSCQVPVLLVHLGTDIHIALAEHPLASVHLRRLEFSEVMFRGSFLDFSSCTALEVLKMRACVVGVGKIFSPSLKQLSVTRCNFNFHEITRISVPDLVSLELVDCEGQTPLLESMPSLERVYVKLGWFDEDRCGKGVDDNFLEGTHKDSCSESSDEDDCSEGADGSHSAGGTNEGHIAGDSNEDHTVQCDKHAHCTNEDRCSEDSVSNYCDEDTDSNCCGLCANCRGNDNNHDCVLLGGLSNATYLRLTPSTPMFTIKRDLRWCPMFTNLRTLVIDECCLSSCFHALLHLLQHTPLLRTLILNMQKAHDYEYHVEKEFSNWMQLSLRLPHLRVVEVKCKTPDNRTWELLKILDVCGIYIQQCNIRRVSW